ncbi:MAG: DNA repair protein RecN, partial [Anaerolineae bacterium]
IDEIESAAVVPGEEKALREERPRLANAQRLTQLVQEAVFALTEGESQGPSAVDSLGTALRALAEGSRVDGSLGSMLQSAEGISFRIEELVRELLAYQEQIHYDPERLQEVEDRLSLLGRLKRKYGETIEDVVSYAEGARRELDAITHSDERIVELEAAEVRLLEALSKHAVELSERRRDAAKLLAQGIEEELVHLSMDGAQFGMAFIWRPAPDGVPVSAPEPVLGWRVSGSGVEETERAEDTGTPRVAFDHTGIDRVEFLVSANPGEPLKAMTKIASGGETSRLMLALKAVLCRADETPTLIFDEIDQGIGGRVAGTVGEKLWGLAVGRGPSGLKHQVLCVTHLPQLAGFGDVHLRVEKHVERRDGRDRTVTRVRTLDTAERVAELANMLGGMGDAVHRSAEELLEQVGARKNERATSPV